MNTGLQDAHNIAWKLAMVVKGHADKTLLSTYESGALKRHFFFNFCGCLNDQVRWCLIRYGQRERERKNLCSESDRFCFTN